MNSPPRFSTYSSGWIEADVYWGYDLDFGILSHGIICVNQAVVS